MKKERYEVHLMRHYVATNQKERYHNLLFIKKHNQCRYKKVDREWQNTL